MAGERGPEGLRPKDVLLLSVRTELRAIAQNYTFNTFSHFHQLAQLQKGSPTSTPIQVFRAWREQYNPATFIEEHGGGNCVDFAVLTKRRLEARGIHAYIIGKTPDEDGYTPAQQEYMLYRHTPVIVDIPEDSTKYMVEPGWRHPYEIPVLPVGSASLEHAESWRFTTVGMQDSTHVVQKTISPLGKESERVLEVVDIEKKIGDIAEVTRRLMQVPRRLELITRLGQDLQIVSFDPRSGKLHASIKDHGFPKEFLPSDITDEQNTHLSTTFGIPDLRQYLTDALAFRDSLPEEFWIR